MSNKSIPEWIAEVAEWAKNNQERIGSITNTLDKTATTFEMTDKAILQLRICLEQVWIKAQEAEDSREAMAKTICMQADDIAQLRERIEALEVHVEYDLDRLAAFNDKRSRKNEKDIRGCVLL